MGYNFKKKIKLTKFIPLIYNPILETGLRLTGFNNFKEKKSRIMVN
jgi:hypothetical protein